MFCLGSFQSSHIEEELVPGRIIRLKRNKLGIYGKDGFFKSHVDTPSNDNMIGTLIVCLPSRHKGGELVISHDGHEHVFDFSKLSNDPSRFQWAAFYGDCIHEVRPVAEGFRVAITYSILCEERGLNLIYLSTDDREIEEHFEISAKCQLRSFAKVDCSLENLPKRFSSKTSGEVGFLLKHKYTLPGLQLSMLKGEDKGLFDYLTDKGWKCQLKTTQSRFMTTTVSIDIEDMDYEETHEIYMNSNHFPPILAVCGCLSGLVVSLDGEIRSEVSASGVLEFLSLKFKESQMRVSSFATMREKVNGLVTKCMMWMWIRSIWILLSSCNLGVRSNYNYN